MSADIVGVLSKKMGVGKTWPQAVLKRPAAATAVCTWLAKRGKGEPAGVVSALDDQPLFPGLSKHAPIRYLNSTIYFNGGKQCWRLKLQPGDRLDKKFPWKGDPPEQWQKALDYCRTGKL